MKNNFDWAWAEKKEREEAMQALLQAFYEEDPLYELLWLCLNSSPKTAVELDPLSFDYSEGPDLLSPPGFPELHEQAHLLEACCQNKVTDHAYYWLKLCLEIMNFPKEQLAQTLLDGCWKGWFLGPRSILAQCLIDNGANVHAHSSSGDTSLLSLFRAWDDPTEIAFSGSIAPACDVLLQAGADPATRNRSGVSPLSRINERLSETMIGMMDNVASADYMLCARLLIDKGADPLSVRESPPLESLISHPGLLGMIQGALEGAEIEAYLTAKEPVTAAFLDTDLTSSVDGEISALFGTELGDNNEDNYKRQGQQKGRL